MFRHDRNKQKLALKSILSIALALAMMLALLACANQDNSPSSASQSNSSGGTASQNNNQSSSGGTSSGGGAGNGGNAGSTLAGSDNANNSTAASGNSTPNAATGAAAGADLVIKIADITGKASFYPIDIDGIKMEVLAVKAPDGTIRTAFNTCEVCYDSGRGYYKQDGDALVCQNCGNRFKTSQVGIQSRGCNPWPIFDEDKTATAESITISYAFLKESTEIFANWKRSY